MNFDFPHTFSKEDAKVRLQALTDYLHNRHGISCAWDGDRGTVKGKVMLVSIDGEFALSDKLVQVKGKDPGMLWRKKAIDYLKHKLETYLDPATQLSDLPRGK